MKKRITKGNNYGEKYSKTYEAIITFSNVSKKITEEQIDNLVSKMRLFFESQVIRTGINRQIQLTLVIGNPTAVIIYNLDTPVEDYIWTFIEKDCDGACNHLENFLSPLE
jgi:hypothetical protein